MTAVVSVPLRSDDAAGVGDRSIIEERRLMSRRYHAVAVHVFAAAVWWLSFSACARDIWTVKQANAWYDRQPWMVGANYIPASAINQLEMWQAETFDPEG